MFPLAAERNAAFIIMHMQGDPRTMQLDPHYDDVVAEVADFFRQRYERALEFGIDPMAIAFDPGIGFGKTLEHNLKLLGNLESLRVHDRPLVVGVSRKGFSGKNHAIERNVRSARTDDCADGATACARRKHLARARCEIERRRIAHG